MVRLNFSSSHNHEFSPVGDRPQRRSSVEGQEEDHVGHGPEDEEEAEDGDRRDHDNVVLCFAAESLGDRGGLHHELELRLKKSFFKVASTEIWSKTI